MLKTLLAKKRLDGKKAELQALRDKLSDIEKRESELETAIAEAETDEEIKAVEEAVEEITKEKAENAEETKKLESAISEIEGEISEAEKKQDESRQAALPEKTTRKAEYTVETTRRTKFFGMNVQERDAFLGNENVKSFLAQIREIGRRKETRAVTGADLTIPTEMLELIRETIENYSKLIGKVNKKTIGGKARQLISGGIPEAVWTEACAKLNELDLNFYSTEIDGYKVGGYIAICNATLEDSDLALATEIINAIGKSIGYAIDKAIIYGTGTKMPLGIVTRIAQTSKPSDYDVNDRTWADIHTKNVVSIAASSKATALYQELILASGKAEDKYSTGNLVWVMNKNTFNQLKAQALTINAAGVIVSGQTGTMPVAGGEIVELNFVPDNNIIVGYFDNYLLGERAGTSIASSTEYRFLEDQTVFKGTARYDGKPVIPEAFAVIGLNGATPTTSVTFAPDTANASAMAASDNDAA